MDCIRMNGLQFYGFHGALSEENHLGQRFIVQLALYLDLHRAGKTDAIMDTVNYAAVYECVKSNVEGTSVKLIEHLAEKIAQDVLKKFPLLQEVEVEVEKPGAPIPGVFGNVSATIRRQRMEYQ